MTRKLYHNKAVEKKILFHECRDRMLEAETIDKETSTENVNIVEESKDLS